jgi:sigma-B regulation protein RsbU (phosphoserine phosphatase)
MDESDYTEHSSLPFRPGQILFIGTDGVWEMPDASGSQFGKDRLRAVLRECAARSADEIAHALRERLILFRGDAKPVDDVTFVVVKILPNRSQVSG